MDDTFRRLDIAGFLAHARSLHVLRLRTDGIIDDCNDAVVRNFGVPRERIVGQNVSRFVTAADAHRLMACLCGHRNEMPILVNFCDAEHLPYTLECSLYQDSAGATLIGEAPLKENQQIQRDLMTLTQDLGVLSRERSRLIEGEQRARVDAEAASREKDRAIATIAHELRQPLGPMAIAVELLTRTEAGSQHGQRALGTLQRQVSQLTRLVEDLLDAARIREDKLTLKRTRFNLCEFLRDLEDGFATKASQQGIAFEAILPVTPVFVDADLTRLTQVFSNLFENAHKYTSAGGRISLALSRQGATAAVTLRDTGRGITADMLPRVFEMFAQQGEGERGGLGIGLAVASGIVAMHGGAISARSDGPGHGSEFTVCLPVLNQGD